MGASADGTGLSHGGVTLHNGSQANAQGTSRAAGGSFPRCAVRVSALGLTAALCIGMPWRAHSSDWTGEVALTSQLVDRGLALTPPTPTVQVALSLALPDGWSLGVSAGAEIRSPGHIPESLAQLSRAVTLSNDWQMQASLLYYHYADIAQARIYDRTEAGLGWTYRDILSFNLSADYAIGANESRVRPAADLNLRWPLPWHLSLSAGAGVAQYVIAPYHRSSGYDYTGTYRYGHAGLLWSQGAWRVELDRVFTDPTIRQHWNSLAASPWLGTISWSF
jgi:uncharacterized protein (TIGR02001 family)